MSERECKKCGNMDFGIWGYLALLGWSLAIGSLGYVINMIYSNPRIPIIGYVFGLVFMVPSWIISVVAQREKRKKESQTPYKGP